MPFVTLPLAYLGWHYTLALVDLVRNGRNLVAFVYHFFSLPTLGKTLLAPWRRLGEGYKKGFDPNAWFETLIVNTIMRVFGAIIRVSLIVIGLVALVGMILLVLVVLVLWLFLPALVVGSFVAGIKLLLL